MQAVLMQDWVTLRGAALNSPASVVQTETNWIDVSAFQDSAAWIDVREATGPTGATNLYIDLQTSATKDEACFVSVFNALGTASSGIALAAANGPIVQRLLRDAGAYTSLAKWMRWVVSTNGVSATQVWDVTFRIWLAVSYGIG